MTGDSTGPNDRSVTHPLDKQFPRQTRWHVNINQVGIIITEDKVRLCLNKHIRHLEQRRLWLVPLGIFATLACTFATAHFKDFLLAAQTWQAIFTVAAIASFVWLINAVRVAGRALTLDTLLDEMKRSGSAPIPRGRMPAQEEHVPPSRAPPLQIVTASYGSSEESIDVTRLLQGRIHEGRLRVRASNALAGDPHPEHRKQLHILYRCGETEWEATLQEGETVDLPRDEAIVDTDARR